MRVLQKFVQKMSELTVTSCARGIERTPSVSETSDKAEKVDSITQSKKRSSQLLLDLAHSGCIVGVCLFAGLKESVYLCTACAKSLSLSAGDFSWHMGVLKERLARVWKVRPNALVCCKTKTLGEIARLGRVLSSFRLVSFPGPDARCQSPVLEGAGPARLAAAGEVLEGAPSRPVGDADKAPGTAWEDAASECWMTCSSEEGGQICGACWLEGLVVKAFAPQGPTLPGDDTELLSVSCPGGCFDLVLRASPCSQYPFSCPNYTMQICPLCGGGTHTCESVCCQVTCTQCARSICNDCLVPSRDDEYLCNACAFCCTVCASWEAIADEFATCAFCGDESCKDCFNGDVCNECNVCQW